MTTYYEAINWNEIEDVIDKSTWEKLTEQFGSIRVFPYQMI